MPRLLHLRRSDVGVLAESLRNTLLFLQVTTLHYCYVLLLPVFTACSRRAVIHVALIQSDHIPLHNRLLHRLVVVLAVLSLQLTIVIHTHQQVCLLRRLRRRRRKHAGAAHERLILLL